MINQQEAEVLAIKMVDDFLQECGASTIEDKANALMKLCSVAGVVMARETGIDEAVQRMVATAGFLQRFKSQPPLANY